MLLLTAILSLTSARAATGWPPPLQEPALTRGATAPGSGTLGYRVSVEDTAIGARGAPVSSRRLIVAVDAEWALARRLTLDAIVPAMAVRGRTGTAAAAAFAETAGFSDASLSLNLRLDRPAEESELGQQLDPSRSCLWAGIQAPTGITSATDSTGEQVTDPTLLPGAGIFSGLAGIRYVSRADRRLRLEAAASARIPITSAASGERRGAAWQARVAAAWQPARAFGAALDAFLAGTRPDAIGGDSLAGTGRTELRAGPSIRWRPGDRFLITAGVSFPGAAWISGAQPVSPTALSAGLWTTL